MKNSSNNNESKETKTRKLVFGTELPLNAQNEIKLICDSTEEFIGVEGTTFADVLSKAIQLRVNPKYDLKPFSELSEGSRRNFVNRLAKSLGSTKEYGYNKGTIQALAFNIETQTGLKATFNPPIDYSKNVSPQIKRSTFTIKGKATYRKSDVKLTDAFIERAKAFKEALIKQPV